MVTATKIDSSHESAKNFITVGHAQLRLQSFVILITLYYCLSTLSDDHFILINSHIHQVNQSACFHPIKNVFRGKNVLLLCHLSK
jgi:hypothetical protein